MLNGELGTRGDVGNASLGGAVERMLVLYGVLR